jgi:sulfur carrier protein
MGLNFDYNWRKSGVSTGGMLISILVNGEAHTVRAGETILDLLRKLGIDPERVAIELDRRIIKQPQWAETELREGTAVEIVQFVGGG